MCFQPSAFPLKLPLGDSREALIYEAQFRHSLLLEPIMARGKVFDLFMYPGLFLCRKEMSLRTDTKRKVKPKNSSSTAFRSLMLINISSTSCHFVPNSDWEYYLFIPILLCPHISNLNCIYVASLNMLFIF